jgi:TldD protein
LILLALLASLTAGEPLPDDPALTAAQAEIDRAMEALSDEDEPPYHLSVGIVDTLSVRIASSNGALATSREDRYRVADVDVRVGRPELDNTHKIRDASWFSEEMRDQIRLPLDGDPAVTQRLLWKAIDERYQGAVRRLSKVKGNESVKVERDDRSPDFSQVEAVQDVRMPQHASVDVEAWEAVTREVSRVFLAHPDVLDSHVELVAEEQLLMFASSEGHLIQHPRARYRVSLYATTVAPDGMQLEVYDYVDASTMEGLPGLEELLVRAEASAARLKALREAPLLEPYTGPALLEGRAAGVFFHEVFGHRMEGHRQKDEDEGQTFTDMVGEPILPAFLDVYDDPTLRVYAGTDLNGTYPYDDEGVPSQRVDLVVEGVLQSFLTSRMPIESVPVSNGHGRRQPGNAVVARQGNLIVEASETVTHDQLREQLIQQVVAQGKPYGLIVEDITGGFTLTGRVVPNSFNVRPVAVWKVYPDGRADELVRGGDLIGTPLTTFSRILAAGDDPQVFNGVCGAESGWVPVSAVSPSLLVEEVEIQRKEKSNDRPPLLPAPGTDAGGDA